MFEAVDVLFVDEAGPDVARQCHGDRAGCEELVLLGDPQQLEQPIQGAHPLGTEVSALEHC
jgi:uncharacterized protein